MPSAVRRDPAGVIWVVLPGNIRVVARTAIDSCSPGALYLHLKTPSVQFSRKIPVSGSRVGWSRGRGAAAHVSRPENSDDEMAMHPSASGPKILAEARFASYTADAGHLCRWPVHIARRACFESKLYTHLQLEATWLRLVALWCCWACWPYAARPWQRAPPHQRRCAPVCLQERARRLMLPRHDTKNLTSVRISTGCFRVFGQRADRG